jgi:hypothetical protein
LTRSLHVVYSIRVIDKMIDDPTPGYNRQPGKSALERKRKQRENAEFRKTEQLANTMAKRAKRISLAEEILVDQDAPRKRKRPNRQPGMPARERSKKLRENLQYREKEKLADRLAKREKLELPGALEAVAEKKRHRLLIASERRRKRKMNSKKSNHRRRRKLTPRDLAIEDFAKCEDNTNGRKYPVRKQRIMEHLAFVLTTVQKFPDAEELVRMGLLEGLGAVLKRLGAVRDIIVSVLDVLAAMLFYNLFVCYDQWSESLKTRGFKPSL